MSDDKSPKLLEGSEFLQSKREVEMWKLATTVAALKQAPRVVLNIIDKKARDFSTRLDKTKLTAAGDNVGLSYLLAELGKYFSKDRVQTVFISIENLETFIRPKDMSILDFVKEFSRRVDAVLFKSWVLQEKTQRCRGQTNQIHFGFGKNISIYEQLFATRGQVKTQRIDQSVKLPGF